MALARERGSVISRDRLVELCWGGRTIGEDAVNRCIAKVRRLAEAHGGFSVGTISGVGYTLLERLAVLRPGLLPAEITRDPLYFIPLAENSRYRAFAKRLEAQIENYAAESRKLEGDR